MSSSELKFLLCRQATTGTLGLKKFRYRSLFLEFSSATPGCDHELATARTPLRRNYASIFGRKHIRLLGNRYIPTSIGYQFKSSGGQLNAK